MNSFNPLDTITTSDFIYPVANQSKSSKTYITCLLVIILILFCCVVLISYDYDVGNIMSSGIGLFACFLALILIFYILYYYLGKENNAQYEQYPQNQSYNQTYQSSQSSHVPYIPYVPSVSVQPSPNPQPYQASSPNPPPYQAQPLQTLASGLSQGLNQALSHGINVVGQKMNQYAQQKNLPPIAYR